MTIDYNDLRKASTPNGIIGLLSSLGHEPTSDWDGLVDIREIILEDNIPNSIRYSVADDALTIREMSSLVGEEKGIECYCAILRPGLKLSSSVCRNLSHAFRNVSSITRIDETFLFIGVTNENHNGSINGETEIIQWATIHLSRVYRKAGSSEELRLSRLDWKPTKKSRHTLDCLKSLQVDAYPGQVDDTEVERFKKEVKEWFNKEKLSRRFFREFYKRFEFALDLVQRKALLENYELFQPTKNKPITSYNKKDRESDSNRQNAGKFMLKQILRLLFLHYLQEKEWLCKDKHFLINQWRHYEKKTHSLPNYDATTATGFHSEVLIPLFFETLNRRRPDDASDNWGPTRWDRGDRSKMPYLNGGIFEIDRTHDHFDFDSATPLFLIPDAVFSADRDYDPKLDDETLVGRQVNILAFLDDYHFTIAEDTPVDEAVALDPELMGKIFENLLVSRHSDGAYYTPRSIVRFQCKDTLARYLEEQLADIEGLDYDWLLTLFDLDRDFSQQGPIWEEEKFSTVVADRIKIALSECKVLDPAVGSGAYLLGMLTEMLRLRQVCHRVRTGHMVDRGSVEFYQWKSEIIKQSLYGVDINPEAISICHLRLWLAMVVDQNRGSTSPLPNLLFQITAGDSLRDSINGHKIFVPPGQKGQSTLWSHFEQTKDDEPNDDPIKSRIGQITQLREIHYDENVSPSKRAQTCEEIQKLRTEMMVEGINQLESYEIKQIKNSRANSTKKNKQIDDITRKFNDSRNRINEGSFTSIFSYEAIFGDVFLRENREGFDIIIGNPPYLEDEGKGGYDDLQALLGLKSNNLYAMFWIRAIRDLARKSGQVSFITSDTFLTIRSHQETRLAMLKESRIHYAIQAGNWFFTFNNAWTAILTVSVRNKPMNTSEIYENEEMVVAYDITKLPSRDIASLEMALDCWRPTPNTRARTANIRAEIIDAGDESTWNFTLHSGEKSYIGRYSYPLGIMLRNDNIPLFMACPKLFKLTWNQGEWKRISNPRAQDSKFVDSIPTNLVEFNDKKIELMEFGSLSEVKVGLQTGDDNYYLRKTPTARGSMPVVDTEKILTNLDLQKIHDNSSLRQRILKNGINDIDFNGKTIVPYAKPPLQSDENLLMFWSRIEYYIDWSEKSVNELRNHSVADVKRRKNLEFIGNEKQEKTRAAVIRNERFYFTDCLHISVSGENAPQTWLGWMGIPGTKCLILTSSIVSAEHLLSIISGQIFIFFAKAFRGSLSDTGQNQIASTPVPKNHQNHDKLIQKIVSGKKNGGAMNYFNPNWMELCEAQAKDYGFSDEDYSEFLRWKIRRFTRPGVIE